MVDVERDVDRESKDLWYQPSRVKVGQGKRGAAWDGNLFNTLG